MKRVIKLDQTKGNLVLRQEINREKIESFLPSIYFNDRNKSAIAAINGSLYNTETTIAKPYGTVYYGHGITLNPQVESTWLVDAAYNGQTLEIDKTIDSNTWFCIGGFACIKDGKIDSRKWDQTAHLFTSQPRTAICQDYDGNIIMFVTDGRPDGMTALEVAEFLRDELNVENALLLDGGGSSIMYADNEIVNINENRANANALVFYSEDASAITYEVFNDKLVCLNAGHLMSTAGKCTPPYLDGSVIRECQQNYPVMFEVERQLNYNGIKTVITNEDMNAAMPSGGNNEDIQNRIDFEKASGADIYVSMHKNAGPEYEWDDDITGTETVCYSFGFEAEKLARAIHARVIEYSGDKDRGVKEQNLAECRETNAPAALCELEFMTNHPGAADMLDKEAQYVYATGIAHGICDYFKMEYNKLAIAGTVVVEPIDPVVPTLPDASVSSLDDIYKECYDEPDLCKLAFDAAERIALTGSVSIKDIEDLSQFKYKEDMVKNLYNHGN